MTLPLPPLTPAVAESRLPAPVRPWRAEALATLVLAWPLITTNLAQIAIGATDVVMMGWLGPEALASGTLGSNLYLAFFIVGFGLASATAPMLAQALGHRANSVRDVRRTVRAGLWATTLMVIPLWLALWHTGAILRLLGQSDDLAEAAQGYVRAMQWGLLPLCWYMVLRSFVSALQRPRAAMVVMVLAIFLNIASNWLLMFGHWGFPRLGLVGAGVSSALAGTFLFVGLALYCLWDRRLRRYALFGRFWRLDGQRLLEIGRIGLPIVGALVFEMTVFNAAVFLVGLIGPETLAAHAVAIQIASVTFMVPMGLGQAATVRVGLAAGRRDAAGVGRAGWVALGMGIGFMAAMAAVLWLAPGPLVGLFIHGVDDVSLRVRDLAVTFLGIAAIFQMVDGAQVVGHGVLRGLKDTRMPMIYAGVGCWGVGLPVSAALAFSAGWGGLGVWIGLAFGLALVAVLLVYRWTRREALGLVDYSTTSSR